MLTSSLFCALQTYASLKQELSSSRCRLEDADVNVFEDVSIRCDFCMSKSTIVADDQPLRISGCERKAPKVIGWGQQAALTLGLINKQSYCRVSLCPSLKHLESTPFCRQKSGPLLQICLRMTTYLKVYVVIRRHISCMSYLPLEKKWYGNCGRFCRRSVRYNCIAVFLWKKICLKLVRMIGHWPKVSTYCQNVDSELGFYEKLAGFILKMQPAVLSFICFSRWYTQVQVWLSE